MSKKTKKHFPRPAACKGGRCIVKPCRAAEVGHRSCDCGGEYCGRNAFPNARKK